MDNNFSSEFGNLEHDHQPFRKSEFRPSRAPMWITSNNGFSVLSVEYNKTPRYHLQQETLLLKVAETLLPWQKVSNNSINIADVKFPMDRFPIAKDATDRALLLQRKHNRHKNGFLKMKTLAVIPTFDITIWTSLYHTRT